MTNTQVAYTRFLSIGAMTAVLFSVLLTSAQHADAAISGTMNLGSKGSQVTQLQQFLATNAFIYPQAIVTGFYGPLTQSAVTQFQVAYDLPQVGRVGPMTLEKINEIVSSGLGLDTIAPNMGSLSVQANRTDATISWSTSELARGQVFYDVNPIRFDEAESHADVPYVSGILASNNTDFRVAQSVSLTNLQPNTIYYYLVRATDGSGNMTMTVSNMFRTNQ
ncbi:MAG: hypothetical protein RLZZ347_287 [Candidatus Parcubacteria bacterium]|jgi:peptidoglycan hydrolase-like protein with peptidoglycan-binding domain